MYYVIIINTLASAAVAFLLQATLRKPDKTSVDYVLMGLFAAELGWLISDGLGFILAVRFGFISSLHGGITGNMILIQVFFIYLFCEVYPRGRVSRGFMPRLLLVALTGLPLSYIVFTPLWIVNRRVVDGIKAGDPGSLFAVLPAWCVAVIFLGLFMLLMRAREADRRSKRNAYIFAVAALVNMALALLVSFVLVHFGIYRFNFLGPVTCVVLVSSILYGISFHHLADMKTLAIRYVVHAFVGGAIALSVFAYASTVLNDFVAGLIAFFLGIAYYRVMRPRIEALLRAPRPGRDSVVAEMLSGRMFDTRHLTLNDLLAGILRVAAEKVGSATGLIVTTGPALRPVFQKQGDVPELEADLTRTLVRLERRRLPDFVLHELDRIFLLEGDIPHQGAGNFLTRLSGRYRRVGRALHEELSLLEHSGFSLMAPLISNREIRGYLLLMRRPHEGLLYQEDMDLLDAIRTAAGVLIRNWRYSNEIKEKTVQVQAEMEKLSTVIANRKAVHHPVGNRVLVYAGPAMEEVLRTCEQTANAGNHSVLVLGETGTGKELIARNIHNIVSPDEPFVAVNCAAIPAALWEADIFGHMRGSFTDARDDRPGKIAQAGNGTLFLDEIGEMPLDMQAKMLRLLQERTYYRIGATSGEEARCRFIFATNCDLEQMAEAGTFRRDLFYRINVFPVALPPLRERPDDIAPIASYLVERLAEEFGTLPRGLDSSALNVLLGYHWPGNARELENVLMRSCTAAQSDVLTAEDLPSELRASANGHRNGKKNRNADTLLPPEPALLTGNYRFLVNEYRRSLILTALRKTRGNKTRAAELLGIKRTTLNGQLSELKIQV